MNTIEEAALPLIRTLVDEDLIGSVAELTDLVGLRLCAQRVGDGTGLVLEASGLPGAKRRFDRDPVGRVSVAKCAVGSGSC